MQLKLSLKPETQRQTQSLIRDKQDPLGRQKNLLVNTIPSNKLASATAPHVSYQL